MSGLTLTTNTPAVPVHDPEPRRDARDATIFAVWLVAAHVIMLQQATLGWLS
jgi:hypothetical protein